MKTLLVCFLTLGLVLQDTFPFDVKILSKKLLICERGKGKAAIRLHIDENGKISSYDILTFRFLGKKGKYNFDVPYSIEASQLKYPPIIESNKKFFKEFVSSKIVIKKISKENVKMDNIYLITVNLECQDNFLSV